MSNEFFIDEVKVGMTDGGLACGPVSGDFIVSIKFHQTGQQPKWLSNAESMGFPTLYLNDEDIFDILIESDIDNLEHGKKLYAGQLDNLNGIDISDYDEMVRGIHEDPSNSMCRLLHYLLAVVHCDNRDEFINKTTGKRLDEIDIPVTDIEEEILDEE